MFNDLTTSQDAVPGLLQMGRHLSIDFMIRTDMSEWLISIRDGRVTQARKGPIVMPSYSFSITADESDWQDFLQPIPAPGCNDLFALMRRGVLRFEGDLHPLMSHLLYFKLLLASLRPGRVSL